MNAIPNNEGRRFSLDDLITSALEEQDDLSLVERFSAMHDAGAVPKMARHYRDLIPASLPGENQQFAFEVDLDRCTSCKSCVVACHNLNGLEEHETWRKTGLIVGGTTEEPYKQTITTACHHCAEPACMHGCPAKAYEKDKETGIVRHLDDQCIGCKYCTMTCPYGVPQYSNEKGIVRKCDMCFNRLKAGEAPACVQACPNKAIRITLVDTDTLTARAEAVENGMLPGSPHPTHTTPSTQFISNSPVPGNAMPACKDRVKLDSPHLPLVLMLVLSQASIGVFVVTAMMSWVLPPGQWAAICRPFATVGLAAGMAALAASTFHLGRPLYAFRGVLGWRTSWLSREILAFGAFIKCAVAYVALLYLPLFAERLPVTLPSLAFDQRIVALTGTATAVFGLCGIFCSVMLYHKANRPSWHISFACTRFFMTTVIALLVAAACICAVSAPLVATSGILIALSVAVAAKLMVENQLLTRPTSSGNTGAALHVSNTAKALSSQRRLNVLRIGSGIVGGVVLPWLAFAFLPTPLFVGSLLVAGATLVAGELLERYLFFTTVNYARMPGEAIE